VIFLFEKYDAPLICSEELMLFNISRLKIGKTSTIGTKCYNTSVIQYLFHNYNNDV